MKKSIVFLTMVLPLFALNVSFGFVEGRLQWWEARLRKLAAERAEVRKNGGIDPKVLGIIDSEMRRARDLISVFETDMKDDGSLTHEIRVMTGSDIMAEARKTVPPLCAIRQMEFLADGIKSAGTATIARDIVKPRIIAMIGSTLGNKSESLAARIMEEDITRDEWKNLAAELLLGGMIAGRARMEDEAVSAVAGEMARLLKGRNNTANGLELRAMSVREALEYLGGIVEPCPPDADAAALDAAWTWREIRPSIERNLDSYKKIITMMDSPADIPLERVRELHRRPAELDDALFKNRHARYLVGATLAKTEDTKKLKAAETVVPAIPGNAPALEEIDRIRKSAVLSVTGKEDRKFFEDLNGRLVSIIRRHTQGTDTLFFREEERMRIPAEKEGGRPAAAGEEKFREAKKRFGESVALLNEYRKRSLDCIKVMSDGKKMNPDAIVEEYRYRLQRNKDYLRFAVSLADRSAGLSSVGQSRPHGRFAAAMGRIGSIFRHVGSTLAFDRQRQPFLGRRDIMTIRSLKADFTGTMYSLRADMRSSYARYVRTHSAAEGADRKAREGLREKIAQDEIDAHYSHATECAGLYGQLTYGADALERYGETFGAFLKEARSGAASTGLEYAIRMNTLLLSVKDFDGDRLRRESATKSYLRKEAKAAISRLVYLLQFYKKNRIAIGDEPLREEIAALEGAIGARPSVKIDSWTMNELNVAEIDKKAVKKLSLCVNRASLDAHLKNSGGKENRVQSDIVTISEPALSLSIPGGWEEDAVTETETYLGVVKSYKNKTIDSSIRLVTLPLAGSDAKTEAESWMEKSGCSPVGKEWHSANGLQYIRILGRDRSKNIVETCALSRDGFAVLISGKTTRDRYSLFRPQFRKIVDSIHAAGM